MNVSQLLTYWKIAENPFRGEEARHDRVFARLNLATANSDAGSANGQGTAPGTAASTPGSTAAASGSAAVGVVPQPGTSTHSDFDKILGEPGNPASAVVFGEKGSGKTAIRMQITERVALHNAAQPGAKTFLISYDDWNPLLDQIHRRAGSPDNPARAFGSIVLADHMDAILGMAVTRLVGVVLSDQDGDTLDNGADIAPTASAARAKLRDMPDETRQDLLLLQAIYDQRDIDGERTRRLRKLLKLPTPRDIVTWGLIVGLGWIPFVTTLIVLLSVQPERGSAGQAVLLWATILLAAGYAGALAKRLGWDKLIRTRLGTRLSRSQRAGARPAEAYPRSLLQLDPGLRSPAVLPIGKSDEPRYAMFARLRRVLRTFGYTGTTIIVDRVDEPSLVNGDPDRMKPTVWPLFSHKFLQMDRFGVKLLLPVELRHMLFRESPAFFQEARFDKQNMIERLVWTGPMLYDLCDARLKACLDPVHYRGQEPLTLMDIFEDGISRTELVDSLAQMQQPRDAFKFLYRCLTEHCQNVTADQEAWKVSRGVLESVRKQEAERVQGLARGVRPA